jgi:hypothetical protein
VKKIGEIVGTAIAFIWYFVVKLLGGSGNLDG